MHLTGSTAVAAQFWSAAFPNHMSTLEDFALYAGHNAEWCLFLSDLSFDHSMLGAQVPHGEHFGWV
jgi:hypothetical protein